MNTIQYVHLNCLRNGAECRLSTKAITIKNIQLCIEGRRKFPAARRYQVEVTLGDGSQRTRTAKETRNRVSWDQKSFFDGDHRSVLCVKVYQNHRFGKDEQVGHLKGTLGEILEKLKDDVFEEPLLVDSSDGSKLSAMTIKITLDVGTLQGTNADERRAADTFTTTNQVISTLSSAPQAVGLLSSAVDTAPNFASQMETLETAWGILLQRINLFNKIVAGIAQIHPYTSLAWSVISAANQVLVNQKNRDEHVIRLAGAMGDVFAFVDDAKPLKSIEAHMKTVTLIIQQVTECGYFIIEYTKRKNFWIRTAKYTLSDIDARISSYVDKLRELKTAFLEGVAVQTEITVVRIMNEVGHIAESINLNDMLYADGARYAQEKGCLPGTRELFLRDICDVLNNLEDDAPRVCLLTGVAGSGKSAVAHSIVRLYDGQRRLNSSYCFSRDYLAMRNPQNLFSTIARDLSDYDVQYKSALWGIVRDNKALRRSTSPLEQLEQLLIEPSKHLHGIGPLIIVIDAIDECGDQAGRQLLLRAISKQMVQNTFPANLRFLITARPESDILSAFRSGSNLVHKRMGDVSDDIVDEDIRKFVSHSLHQYAELDLSWPNQEWCRLLVDHSQHLFQWASTTCNFVEGLGDVGLSARQRLEQVLNNDRDATDPLDHLYGTVLHQLYTSSKTRNRFQYVMAIILSLKEPLSIGSLCALFESETDLNVREVIKPLASLLDGVLDEEKPIRPLHTSFRDFLLDQARSSIFSIHIQPQHHLHLGQAMIHRMRAKLRFNICGLEDSRKQNTAVPDLLCRVRKEIPTHLVYSCQYWMVHLQHAQCPPDLLDEVTLFFKNSFPYWLEAISLLSLSSPLSFILSAIETCTILTRWAKGQEIANLASEASQFIKVFSPVLRECTPHLYLSAMAQTPSSSPLCALWNGHLQKHISVTSGCPVNWPSEIHTLEGHTDGVNCVVYSPDGTHIVSGSRDKTIRIWSAATGQTMGGPLEGHMDSVNSLSFSPDGTFIVSGSSDKTIRVWHMFTGQTVTGPFEGHTDSINSVAFSPDGSSIVSGSKDNTIQVWNAVTGQVVAGPFKGHTGSVNSVAYSPDGAHIVSGSWDCTIRVWNAVTGQTVVGPFHGNTNLVHSVAYSPDGSCIVSGSHDTMRVWNASTGQNMEGLFKEPMSMIKSVAYSSDGTLIVSGCWDRSIRVWNASTGQTVADLFLGHMNEVNSVAFSPDGSHIVSGSWDKTIRVWKIATSKVMVDPSESKGHMDCVNCVSYSPDGTHIVSGSNDTTIGVWNAATGQIVAGPFQEHIDWVNSVAYSPDGTHIASGSDDYTIRVLDATTGQIIADPLVECTSSVTSVAFSPDGNHIISGSWDKTISVWSVATGQAVGNPYEGHTDIVLSIACSPDGIHIASGSRDKTIRIWNAATGQTVAGPFEGHTLSVCSVGYSPDGFHVVSGSRDKTIRIWNVATGQTMAGPFVGHTDSVKSVAYSPDGTLVVSGADDRTIRVWNATNGHTVAGPFEGHISSVKSVSFSPDGTYIVSGSHDKFIKIWRVDELVFFGDLHIQEGWIQSLNGAVFGWISPWNRYDSDFHLPTHSLIISTGKIYQPDHVDMSLFGESWVLCWK